MVAKTPSDLELIDSRSLCEDSGEELRNPLAAKSLRAILTAQEHLKSGQRERGVQELRQAMNDPAAMPLAISMLGVEHLKAGQLDAALSELDQAVHLLPGRPENHGNLAYALFLTGQTERGLQEARKALQLDPGRPTSRLVLGMLLLQQGSHDFEAVQHLQAAAQEIPSAHLELAKHYDRAGQAPGGGERAARIRSNQHGPSRGKMTTQVGLSAVQRHPGREGIGHELCAF